MTELLTKYPKASKVVKEYFLNKLLESLKADLPEEFKDHVKEQGVKDEDVVNLIGTQPRILFDIFDENKVFIIIDKIYDRELPWSWSINNEIAAIDFRTRKAAELEAIKEAFDCLENKLEENDARTEV